MMRVQARDMTIEAVQWDTTNTDQVREFAGDERVLECGPRVQVRSKEVWVELRPGFWCWRIGGEYHVSSDGAFRCTFNTDNL